YEVQRLFSVNSGDKWICTQLSSFSEAADNLRHRVGASLVANTTTGKLYLKLVNALPVTLQLNLEGLDLPATVECEQLSGNVEDQHAKAVRITTDKPLTLPPYTLRVIVL
ncbi:MAG: alpha-N-arabinofuranosidase, partial [Prevotella sp.]|nr:alpha-N-arabinofuranosidase [Prevotella sp.]